MQWDATLVIPKQESASLLTRRMNAILVTRELGLVQGVIMMTQTHVEMRQHTPLIMDTSIPKPWGTSWYSNRTVQILSRNAIMKKKMSCPKA